MQLKKIIESPGKLPKPLLTLLGFLLVLVIGSIDTLTSYDVSVSFLYLVPIVLVAWFEGGVSAALLSIFSAITWAVSDLASGHIYSHIAAPIWNSVMVLVMLLTVTYAIVIFKKLLVREQEHAHTDELTGAMNFKFFCEQARMEIRRAALERKPLTLAAFNLDNLRQVNDVYGHVAGDYLLHETVHLMKSTARPADMIGRLGGARFAVLLPKTGTQDAAGIIEKVRGLLLDMVKKNGWPVTFSIAVLTCDGPACTIDELIKRTEILIQAARETGANGVEFATLNSSLPASSVRQP